MLSCNAERVFTEAHEVICGVSGLPIVSAGYLKRSSIAFMMFLLKFEQAS